MRRAVRATRQAISPRLAMRILVKHRRRRSVVLLGRSADRTSPETLATIARMNSPHLGNQPDRQCDEYGSDHTSAATGCAKASHSIVPTARSSPNDAAQFENGSGDVLMSARLPALARWLPAASEPPRIAAASVGSGRRIAEDACRERGTGRNANQGVHQIPHRIEAGNLVGEEFDEAHEPRRREHARMREHVKARRQLDPAQVAQRRRR